MDWNSNNILAITGAIVTLISSLTAAICSVIRVLKGPTSVQIDENAKLIEENTRLTRHNCDVNTVAIAHAEAAVASAIIATTTAANTAARVESVVNKIH